MRANILLLLFTIRSLPVAYDAIKGELTVGTLHVPTLPWSGQLDLIIYADYLSLEVYDIGGPT